jgi:hypothetical protein
MCSYSIVYADLKKRLEQEQKVLHELHTPKKKPNSVRKGYMNTEPTKKYRVGHSAEGRELRSEKKMDKFNFNGIGFESWEKMKVEEDKIRHFLIQSEINALKDLVSESTQKSQKQKATAKLCFDEWKAKKEEEDKQKKAQ